VSGAVSAVLGVLLGVIALAVGVLIWVDLGGSILRIMTKHHEWGRRRIGRWAYSTPPSWSKAMCGGFFVFVGVTFIVGR